MLPKMMSARSTAGTSASAHSMLAQFLWRLLGRPEGNVLDTDTEEERQMQQTARLGAAPATLPIRDAALRHPELQR